MARWHEPVSPEAAGHFFQLVERRRSRVPMQHLTGTQEFYGLAFDVTPQTLVPRPETEGIVEEALAELGLEKRASPRIVDVGCGSGCIAIALAKSLPEASVFATDLSGAALAVARENAHRHAVSERVTFFLGDLLSPLTHDERFDLVVSNPPYIAEAEIPRLEPEVSEHEPILALAGGPDGLDVIRRLVPAARDALTAGGRLIFEIGAGQEDVAVEIVASAGLELLRIAKDLAGIPRVVVARKHG